MYGRPLSSVYPVITVPLFSHTDVRTPRIVMTVVGSVDLIDRQIHQQMLNGLNKILPVHGAQRRNPNDLQCLQNFAGCLRAILL